MVYDDGSIFIKCLNLPEGSHGLTPQSYGHFPVGNLPEGSHGLTLKAAGGTHGL